MIVFVNAIMKLLTKSMKQSPSWETDSRLASQEIPRLLGDAKGYNPVHKNPHSGTSDSIKVGHF
jgi:hypothetical protein